MKNLALNMIKTFSVMLFVVVATSIPTDAIGDKVQITSGSGSFPIELNETGSTSQTITIHLDTVAYGTPSDEVAVTCTVDNPSQVTIDDPGVYYFNSKNGFSDKTITISAVDDADQESSPHVVNISCVFTSPDPTWNWCVAKCGSNDLVYTINIADNDKDTDGDTIPDVFDTDDDNDNVTDEIENAGPNSGDGNNDGKLDSLQMDVTTTFSQLTGSYQTLDISGNCKEIKLCVMM